MCQTILVIFCKISTRKKWQFKPAKRDYIFCRLSHFYKSLSEKKGVVLVVVGTKKQMKQNAENAEYKIFIVFI